MNILENELLRFKKAIESSMRESSYINKKGQTISSTNGSVALNSFIRTSIPINYIHEAIKKPS